MNITEYELRVIRLALKDESPNLMPATMLQARLIVERIINEMEKHNT